MVMFLFTCCVILLNILIAQLSDTYQNVQQDAQRGLEVNRAWIVARVELNSLYLGKVCLRFQYCFTRLVNKGNSGILLLKVLNRKDRKNPVAN